MSFKKLVEKYWKDFEVIAFNFIKQKLPQTLIKKEVITQSVKDGGYDGEFLLVSEQKNQIKILFEAKLRSNINGSLPLQEFAKAIIISIVSQADILYIVTNIRFSKNTIEILENYSKFVPLGIELANGLTIKKYILNDINYADKTTQELFDFLVENCEVAVEQNIRSFKPKLLCPSLYEKFESDSATLEVRNLFKNSNEVLVITGNIGSGKSSFIDNMSFYYQCKGKIVSTIDLSKCMTYKDLFIELLEKTLGLSLAVVNQIDEPTFTEIILGNKYIETSQEDIDMLNFIFSKKNEHLYDYSYLFSIIVNFYEKICCLSKNRLNLIIAFKNAAYSHNEVLQLLLYFLKSENTFSSIVELTNDVYLNGDVHFWNSFKENIMSLATYQNWNVNDWSLMEAKHFLMKKVNGLTEEQILSLIHKFGSSPAELANLIEIIDTTEIYVSNPKSLIYAEIMSLNLSKKDILYYKCFEYLQLSNSNMLYLFAFIYFLSGEVYFDLLYEFFNNQNSVENILHLTRKSSLFYVNAQKIEIRNSKIEEQLNKYCEEHLTEFTTRDIIAFLKEKIKSLHLSSEKQLEFRCKCAYYKSEKAYFISLFNLGKRYLYLRQSLMAEKYFKKGIELIENNPQLQITPIQKLQIYIGLIETIIWKIGINADHIERYLNISNKIIEDCDNTSSTFYLLVLKYHLLSYQFFHSQNKHSEALETAEKGVKLVKDNKLYEVDLELSGKMWRFYAIAIKEQTQDIKKCIDIFNEGFDYCGNSAKFLFGYIIHKNMCIEGNDYKKIIKNKIQNYYDLFDLDNKLSIDEYLHYRVNISALKFLQKDYNGAWNDYLKLLEKSIVFNITREKIRILNDMANICWVRKDLVEARKMYYAAKKEAEKCGYIENYWPILINLVSLEVNDNDFAKAWDIHIILKDYLEQKCESLHSNTLGFENIEYIKAAIMIHLKNLLKIHNNVENRKQVLCAIKELYLKSYHVIDDDIQLESLIHRIKTMNLKGTMFEHDGIFLLKD